MRVKMSKQPPPAPTARAVGPCPTLQTSRTPWHWKFTQDHRTTRPPQDTHGKMVIILFVHILMTLSQAISSVLKETR